MVYRGLVRDGVIVLDGSIELPEGTAVTIEALTTPSLSARVSERDHAEKIDRHLGVLGQSSAEGMKAQQHSDRFL